MDWWFKTNFLRLDVAGWLSHLYYSKFRKTIRIEGPTFVTSNLYWYEFVDFLIDNVLREALLSQFITFYGNYKQQITLAYKIIIKMLEFNATIFVLFILKNGMAFEIWISFVFVSQLGTYLEFESTDLVVQAIKLNAIEPLTVVPLDTSPNRLSSSGAIGRNITNMVPKSTFKFH